MNTFSVSCFLIADIDKIKSYPDPGSCLQNCSLAPSHRYVEVVGGRETLMINPESYSVPCLFISSANSGWSVWGGHCEAMRFNGEKVKRLDKVRLKRYFSTRCLLVCLAIIWYFLNCHQMHAILKIMPNQNLNGNLFCCWKWNFLIFMSGLLVIWFSAHKFTIPKQRGTEMRSWIIDWVCRRTTAGYRFTQDYN